MNAPAAINRASRIPATSEITQCRLGLTSFDPAPFCAAPRPNQKRSLSIAVSAVIGAVLWGPYYAYGYGYPYLAAPNPEIPLASDAIRGSLISKKRSPQARPILKRMRLNTEANRTIIDRPGPLHLAPMTAASAREGGGQNSTRGLIRRRRQRKPSSARSRWPPSRLDGWTFVQRIAVGATVEPVAPCSFSGCRTSAKS